jgi:hypothetical protein
MMINRRITQKRFDACMAFATSQEMRGVYCNRALVRLQEFGMKALRASDLYFFCAPFCAPTPHEAWDLIPDGIYYLRPDYGLGIKVDETFIKEGNTVSCSSNVMCEHFTFTRRQHD